MHDTLKSRDDSFDVLRGVAIIAVIAIHATTMELVEPNTKNSFTNLYFLLMIRQCYNFAVPSFLFVSGFFIGRRSQPDVENYGRFLLRRLKQVLVPYFVWSLSLLAYGAVRTGEFSSVSWLRLLVTGQVMGHFYFPLLIAQFYILTPVIKRLILSLRIGFLILLLLNGAYLSWLYFLRYSFGVEPNFAITALPFISWLFFFSFGILVGGNQRVLRWLEQRVLLWLALSLLGVFMQWAEAIIAIKLFDQPGGAASALKFSSFFYSFALLSAFIGIRNIGLPANSLLIFTGRNSYAIYLAHGLILTKVYWALYGFGLSVLSVPERHIIIVASTFIACLAFVTFVRGVCGKRISSILIG